MHDVSCEPANSRRIAGRRIESRSGVVLTRPQRRVRPGTGSRWPLRLRETASLLVRAREPVSLSHSRRSSTRRPCAGHARFACIRRSQRFRYRRVLRPPSASSLRDGSASSLPSLESICGSLDRPRVGGQPEGSSVLGECHSRVHERHGGGDHALRQSPRVARVLVR
jgi:hypothetical protein